MSAYRTLFAACLVLLSVTVTNVATVHADGESVLFLPIMAAPEPETAHDVIDAMTADGNYTEFLNALDVAGIDTMLRSSGPFTVFAPTDMAFERLEQQAPGALEQLLDDPSGILTQILEFHLVEANLMYADLSDGLRIETVHGAEVQIDWFMDEVRVNGAKISQPDTEASNGVVHGIDAIVLPPID